MRLSINQVQIIISQYLRHANHRKQTQLPGKFTEALRFRGMVAVTDDSTRGYISTFKTIETHTNPTMHS